MTEGRAKRKLTAIFSADVKGYSRLMGEDEEGTVRILNDYRVAISDLIAKHRGRVVDSPGDNILAEFASVVDSVKCAVDIQKELKDNSNFNPDYLKTALEKYTISSEDMASLYDEFSNINTDFLVPFLLTNINLARYQKAEKQRHGASVTARADTGLVLSNGDGTKKVYFMHFHNLSEKDLRQFVGTINTRNPDVKYLVPKKELKLLFTE